MSDKRKRTPWFDVASQPPRRRGWYEWEAGDDTAGTRMMYWDGALFGDTEYSAISTWHGDRWRGLAERSE